MLNVDAPESIAEPDPDTTWRRTIAWMLVALTIVQVLGIFTCWVLSLIWIDTRLSHELLTYGSLDILPAIVTGFAAALHFEA